MSTAWLYWRRSSPRRLDPGRPGDDQRVGGAALVVRVALPQLERRVERPGPPGRVVVVRPRAAELVEVLEVLLHRVGEAVEELVLVDRAVRPALARGAVVGDEHDDRVLELTALLEVVEQAAELVVGVAEEAGVDLGHAGEQPLLVVGERLPGPHAVSLRPRLAVVARRVGVGVDRRQLGALGDDPELLLALEDALAIRLVAHVEHALVPVRPLLRDVVRRVGGARAVVEEERLVRRDRLRVLDELDRLVGEIDREVVALLGRLRRGDRMVVVDEVRVPLVRLAAEEAVVALEAAAERPLALRRGEVHLVLGAEMPLADDVGVPAALAEHLGDVRALEGDVAVRVREARRSPR